MPVPPLTAWPDDEEPDLSQPVYVLDRRPLEGGESAVMLAYRSVAGETCLVGAVSRAPGDPVRADCWMRPETCVFLCVRAAYDSSGGAVLYGLSRSRGDRVRVMLDDGRMLEEELIQPGATDLISWVGDGRFLLADLGRARWVEVDVLLGQEVVGSLTAPPS